MKASSSSWSVSILVGALDLRMVGSVGVVGLAIVTALQLFGKRSLFGKCPLFGSFFLATLLQGPLV